MNNDIVVLIPAYNPEKDKMITFLNELTSKFSNIVVINDGSDNEFTPFFKDMSKKGVDVIYHKINKGKGRAIKTGFDYILKNYKNLFGIVTADCDGQHTVKDIEKCANKLRENPDDLIIGCRDFNEKNIPSKSKIGNKITRLVFKLFIGITITDTQSGLRAFGKDLIKLFINTEGERYEYETNVLIECKTKNIKIEEETIETIYLDNNQGSHFNPLVDSLKIYRLFFKYILAAMTSFILDIVLFTFLVNIMEHEQKILISTIIARIVSSIYNFVFNSKVVFNQSTKASLFKYIILVILQMFVSGYAVTFISYNLPLNSSIIKIIVDTFIFIENFIIQREWVFKEKK